MQHRLCENQHAVYTEFEVEKEGMCIIPLILK